MFSYHLLKCSDFFEAIFETKPGVFTSLQPTPNSDGQDVSDSVISHQNGVSFFKWHVFSGFEESRLISGSILTIFFVLIGWQFHRVIVKLKRKGGWGGKGL